MRKAPFQRNNCNRSIFICGFYRIRITRSRLSSTAFSGINFDIRPGRSVGRRKANFSICSTAERRKVHAAPRKQWWQRWWSTVKWRSARTRCPYPWVKNPPISDRHPINQVEKNSKVVCNAMIPEGSPDFMCCILNDRWSFLFLGICKWMEWGEERERKGNDMKPTRSSNEHRLQVDCQGFSFLSLCWFAWSHLLWSPSDRSSWFDEKRSRHVNMRFTTDLIVDRCESCLK